MKTYRFHGMDGNGIARVYGIGQTLEIAETKCVEAILEYVRHRPDTGPTSKWHWRESITYDAGAP